MKKIVFILLVMCAAFVSRAQKATTMPLAAGDTAVTSGTAYKVISLTAGYDGIVIQPVVTKVSGTVAGTVVLYESLDGTNYKSTGDTMTATNVATNTVVWKKTAPVPVYYKVLETSSGTMSAILTVKYVARKHD